VADLNRSTENEEIKASVNTLFRIIGLVLVFATSGYVVCVSGLALLAAGAGHPMPVPLFTVQLGPLAHLALFPVAILLVIWTSKSVWRDIGPQKKEPIQLPETTRGK
jgi:hypothetical protein